MKRWQAMVVVLVVALAGGSSVALAAEGRPFQYTLKASDLTGSLTDSAGKPIGGTLLKLVDGNNNNVAIATTDKSGNFTLQDIPAGTYTLEIDEKFSINMKVTEDAELSTLSLVIPDTMLAASQGGLVGTQWVWTVVKSAAVVTAVSIPVIAHELKDEPKHVSP